MPNPVLVSLLRINRQRMRHLKSAIAPYQYTGVMHLILSYVAKNPGSSQEEITNYFMLDKTSVARDAKKLEDMEHIYRIIAPDNRRQYQLHLTDSGRGMYETIGHIYDDFARKLSAGVSPEDWAALEQLLKKLEDGICS